MIADKIKKSIQEALKSVGITDASFVVEHPSDLKMGDYSTNVGIKTGKAKEILAHLEAKLPSGAERVEIAGPGFINFYLTKDFFKESLGEIIEKGGEYGKSEHAKGFKVMVEHTQPNPFKTFHIGHLMNNVLGEAVSRIIKANGAEVKTCSYHGDVGIHVAKAVWGMLKGEKNPYPAGAKAYQEDEQVKTEIQEINKQIYNRSDDKVCELYDEGRKESLNKFYKIYEKLGSKFDYEFFESESGNVGKKLVEGNIGKVFEESEGAIVFKGEKYGLHTRVFLNSDKLPTYEAKELGLADIKNRAFNFGQSITITANEQDAFFQVVEKATEEVFPELAGKLTHLSHGMLKLSTGKMSSRTGDVITAESLIDTVKEKIKGNEEVAIGAIKYMILRQSIGGDIIFDIEKSVSTEGDSGVYLQYAHARACSILKKAKPHTDMIYHISDRETHEVERLLYRFPEVVERAGKEYAPHYIATYLTELAGSFNNFYAHKQVLGDDPESPYRLAIVEAFNIVMKNGLDVLGIPAPEKM